jgi:non-SMC mitotic condensation complex subunit 1
VTLLETLSKYRATDAKDAEHICERVVPQFQHQNASVVMAAVKVVMLNINYVAPEMQRSLIKKMGPPLGISIVLPVVDPSHNDLFGSRSPICSIAEYQPYSAEATRYPQ